jgi:cytochrome bd-type quinol oxidase subunit 2
MIQLADIISFANAQTDAACVGLAATGGSCDQGAGLTGGFATIANTLIFIVGAISVLMVIIGGLRYVLSNGDSAGIKSAKDTIMYALIGVVVSLLAYALVSFVIGRFS